MECSEEYSPVNIEAWEGTVHWAAETAWVKRVDWAVIASKIWRDGLIVALARQAIGLLGIEHKEENIGASSHGV